MSFRTNVTYVGGHGLSRCCTPKVQEMCADCIGCVLTRKNHRVPTGGVFGSGSLHDERPEDAADFDGIGGVSGTGDIGVPSPPPCFDAELGHEEKCPGGCATFAHLSEAPLFSSYRVATCHDSSVAPPRTPRNSRRQQALSQVGRGGPWMPIATESLNRRVMGAGVAVPRARCRSGVARSRARLKGTAEQARL